ncbi:MAG: hypothetical protein N2738_01085, partial [Thermodesulfovibrionales bacterium]|nr:hypothetical protein [Thermodesulfovibrionales bacterium]
RRQRQMCIRDRDYILIDILRGETKGRGKEIVPDYQYIQEFIKTFQPIPYSIEKSEREKRILYAFNGLRCSSESC